MRIAKALIDPADATFATLSWLDGTGPSSIDIYHRGSRVWTIDTLQFGLQRKQVAIYDAVLLSAAP